jgi:hypothetical protein
MNKWSELGEKQMVGPRKSIMRAAKTRAERKLEKEKQDRDILFGQWKEWHLKRKQELLEGSFSGAAQELGLFLEGMTIKDASALIELVSRGPWGTADDDTRFLVLGMISHAIIYLREREGLSPFDDPIPWSDDEPDVFMILKELLR